MEDYKAAVAEDLLGAIQETIATDYTVDIEEPTNTDQEAGRLVLGLAGGNVSGVRLTVDLDADSLDKIEAVQTLEERLGVSIEEKDLSIKEGGEERAIDTIGELFALVWSKLAPEDSQ